LAANGAQTTYEWAQKEGGQDDIVYQLEEVYSQITELEFRAQFLSRPDQKAKIDAAATADGGEMDATSACPDAIKAAKDALQGIVKDITDKIPFGLGTLVQEAFKKLDALLDNASAGSLLAIKTAFTTLKSVLGFIFVGAPTIMEALEKVEGLIEALPACIATDKAASINQASCYNIADLYRATVADVIANAPVLPADASEDLRRYSAGAQAILQIMSKNSIAANNDALLNTRPVFAAELLHEYGTEMVRAGAKDAVQSYAVGSFSFVIGYSNALEACLRIAADPAAAVEDLNEELDFLDDEDEAEAEADEDD
jgi:hypothetical protein